MRAVAQHFEFVPQGALLRPEALRECLVHDGYRLRALDILAIELPPFHEWSAQRTEISRRNLVVRSSGGTFAGGNLIARDFYRIAVPVIAHWNARSYTGRMHSRQAFYFLPHLFVKREPLLFVVTDFAWIERKIQNVTRLEAQTYPAHMCQAARHQS